MIMTLEATVCEPVTAVEEDKPEKVDWRRTSPLGFAARRRGGHREIGFRQAGQNMCLVGEKTGLAQAPVCFLQHYPESSIDGVVGQAGPAEHTATVPAGLAHVGDQDSPVWVFWRHFRLNLVVFVFCLVSDRIG